MTDQATPAAGQATPAAGQATPAAGQATPASFFEEDNGTKSSMRLMCFIALIAAIVFGVLTIQVAAGDANGIYITFGFLLAAFAPKAVQKFAETKIPPIAK